MPGEDFLTSIVLTVAQVTELCSQAFVVQLLDTWIRVTGSHGRARDADPGLTT
jgi:hypothetical protein